MFAGREWIAQMGLYDYRNRFYSSTLGRFLQDDPKGFGGGDFNLLRYASNRYNSLNDPFGTNVWALNSSGAVGGLGHEGEIIGGPDGEGYTYYSYGGGTAKSGSSSLSNGNNLTVSATYDTFAGALQAAQAKRTNPYDSYLEFESSEAQDVNAAAYAMTWQDTNYAILWNNCVEMVNGTLNSIGIDTAGIIIPIDWQKDLTNIDLSVDPAPVSIPGASNTSTSSSSSGGGTSADTWKQDYSDPFEECLYLSPSWTSADANFIQRHVFGWE